MFGPDVPSSLTVDQFRMVSDMRDAVATTDAHGADKDHVAEDLADMRAMFERSLAPKRNLIAGTIVTEDMLVAKKPTTGIPGKNMKRLGELTLAGRATRLATSQPWIDQVIVSTDDPGIAAEVARQGGEAPFMRPAELADDTASSDDMWRHAWRAAEDHYGKRFDVSLLLKLTSPLRLLAS